MKERAIWMRCVVVLIALATMSTLIGDGNAVEEGLWSLGCGVLFGATTVIVGHPFDTIKTRMQADASFHNLSMRFAAINILQQNGIRGFYAGFVPPLIGSSIFRSVQFAAFGATMAYFRNDDSVLRTRKFANVEARVYIGGMVSGACRALIESPLDFLKTQRQVVTPDPIHGNFKQLYRGFSATLARNVFLMTTFFVLIEKLSAWDPFVRGGVATTTAWTLVWPLDVAKSRMQANPTISTNLITTIRDVALNGLLFRGYFAGITRSFLANGASLKVYNWGQCQRLKYCSPKQLTYNNSSVGLLYT